MAWPGYVIDNQSNSRFFNNQIDGKSLQQPVTFRRYLTHSYNSGLDDDNDVKSEDYGAPDTTAGADKTAFGDNMRTYDGRRYYEGIVQGRITRHGKVKFGMVDYRLTRAAKYSNVCRDCAFVLDQAPHLFARNNQVIIDVSLARVDKGRERATRGGEGCACGWSKCRLWACRMRDENAQTVAGRLSRAHLSVRDRLTPQQHRESAWCGFLEPVIMHFFVFCNSCRCNTPGRVTLYSL